ncbi:hypothetical protein TrCOL_g4245 [Triparma columacea]|uniref:Uncharacterized protein n=1 Tax=Triparma columacea TaxID=722753 RepID=A0A9W7LDU8_9STRA|nr:hypothetical protein TrCOL_g4245 [Triparma columacea]
MPRVSNRTHVPSTRLEGFDTGSAKGRKTIRNKAKKPLQIAYDKIRYQTDAYKAKAKARRKKPENNAKAKAVSKAWKKKPENIAKTKERLERAKERALQRITDKLKACKPVTKSNFEHVVEKATEMANLHLESGYGVIVCASSALTSEKETTSNEKKLQRFYDNLYGEGAWAREKKKAESIFSHVFLLDGENGEYKSGSGGIASLETCGFTLGRYAEKMIIAAIGKKLLVNVKAGGGGSIPKDTRYGAVEILVVKLR